MDDKSAKKLGELNELLWTAYEKAIPLNSSAPLAFIIRARTEYAASQVASAIKAFDCRLIDISKRRWPLGRRWEVTGKSSPLPLERTGIERWVRSLAESVDGLDAELTHWVPLEGGA